MIGLTPRRGVGRLATVPREWLVLAVVYAAFAALYVWQASQRVAPTIFTDELELTQISRAIAETGHPARRGVAYDVTSLVPWLTAPFWWIDSTVRAYGAVKAFQALVMTATLFPAYGLARFVVGRRWAVFAAVGTVAAPALSYAPILVEEPFGYLFGTLAVYLTMRAVARPTWTSWIGALLGVGVAAASRSQLVILLVPLGVALLWLWWDGARARAWRATWSTSDWIGAVVIGIGSLVALSAYAGSQSEEWRKTTTHWKGRMWEYGVWATGAWSIGVGLVPAIALLAILARRRHVYACRRARAFAVTGAATAAAIIWYGALKGAYLSTVFSSLVVERNVIYLTPLAFAATAAVLAHRDVSWRWVLLSAAVVYYVATRTPTRLDSFPYYEAHGLSILAFLNRELTLAATTIDTIVVVACLVAAAGVVAMCLSWRSARIPQSIVVALVGLVLCWNVTNEVYAADGEARSSRSLLVGYGTPPNWIDLTTGGRSVTILGQTMNANPLHLFLTEFFNRRVKHVWSIDGSGPGPGPTLTPDVASADGTLTPPAGTDLALATDGVELQGAQLTQRGRPPLTILDQGRLRLVASRSGIDPVDGWTKRRAAFNQFDTPGRPQTATLTLSRWAFCNPEIPLPSEVVVRIGPVVVGEDRQPALGSVLRVERLRVPPCAVVPVTLRTPSGPWRIEIDSDTFVPEKVDPSSTDPRELGVVATLEIGP